MNGVAIAAELFDQALKSNLAQGAKDSPELRAALKRELIAREVLAQEAQRQKLDKDAAVQWQLAVQQKNLLAEAVVVHKLESLKITDESLKAEYKRQVDLLADSDQYQLRQIVVGSEATALEVIREAKAGTSFESLATERSLDMSRQNGGSLGWVLANQVIAPISNVMVNLSVGQIAAAPIQTQEGWHVLKLEGKRKFQAPGFEESREQLIKAIVVNQRADYVQQLIKAAKIED